MTSLEHSRDFSTVSFGVNDVAYVHLFNGLLDTPEKAMFYFSHTEYVDHNSFLWAYFSQSRGAGEFQYAQYLEKAKSLIGTYYVVHEDQSTPNSSPPSWIIHKLLKETSDPSEIPKLIEIFFIMGQWVLRAASITELAETKLIHASYSLKESLNKLRSKLPQTSPRYPTSWTSQKYIPPVKEDNPDGGVDAATGSEVPVTEQAENGGGNGADGRAPSLAPSTTTQKSISNKSKKKNNADGPNFALQRAIALTSRAIQEGEVGGLGERVDPFGRVIVGVDGKEVVGKRKRVEGEDGKEEKSERVVRSREEREADELLKGGIGAVAGGVGTGTFK